MISGIAYRGVSLMAAYENQLEGIQADEEVRMLYVDFLIK